jgi:hypothetical protein
VSLGEPNKAKEKQCNIQRPKEERKQTASQNNASKKEHRILRNLLEPASVWL